MIERPHAWRVSRVAMAVLVTMAALSLVLGTWLYSVAG
jgi:hypothetical protein